MYLWEATYSMLDKIGTHSWNILIIVVAYDHHTALSASDEAMIHRAEFLKGGKYELVAIRRRDYVHAVFIDGLIRGLEEKMVPKGDCPDCNGCGYVEHSHPNMCMTCEGTGKKRNLPPEQFDN